MLVPLLTFMSLKPSTVQNEHLGEEIRQRSEATEEAGDVEDQVEQTQRLKTL